MQTIGVKYIGSKASLVGDILQEIDRRLDKPANLRVIDVFTGTTRVAQAFRAKGWVVQSSDLSWAADAYAHAFLLRTAESGQRIPALIADLMADISGSNPEGDWITKNYCDVSGLEGGLVRMWRPKNGIRGDYIRNRIAEWLENGTINMHESMILVACLLIALDKVDNTVGVQQAYLKEWAKRTDDLVVLNDLKFYNGPPGSHTVGNCLEIAYKAADVAYLDPPYSNHSYSTYYHLWDSITRWDKPAVGLKTNRRIDRVSKSEEFDPTMQSAWNYKSTALQAFLDLCARLPVKYLLISYSDESLIPQEELVDALKKVYGTVHTTSIAYQRNIMSQIGNATLLKDTFKTTNTELLLWVKKN